MRYGLLMSALMSIFGSVDFASGCINDSLETYHIGMPLDEIHALKLLIQLCEAIIHLIAFVLLICHVLTL